MSDADPSVAAPGPATAEQGEQPQPKPRPIMLWLRWYVAAYLGSALGSLIFRLDMNAFNPMMPVAGILGAMIVPGLNFVTVVLIVASVVLHLGKKYWWSYGVAFLGCAFVIRSVYSVWYVGGR